GLRAAQGADGQGAHRGLDQAAEHAAAGPARMVRSGAAGCSVGAGARRDLDRGHMKTDTSEKGLEALIVTDMTGRAAAPAGGGFSEAPEPFADLHNWILGDPKAYDRAWTADLVQLRAFISATQSPLLVALDLDHDSALPAKNSWPRCKARTESAASSRFCATGSSTVRTTWTCFMAPRRPATPRPPGASR